MNEMMQRDVQQHITVLGWLYIACHTLFLIVGGFVFLLLTGIGFGSGDAEAARILPIVGVSVGLLLAALALPGLVAGYGLLTHKPWARILSLVFLGFFYQLLEVPAIIVLGFWFLLQLLNGVAALGAATAQGGVAFFAHIGGFVFGLAVGLLVRVVGWRARWRGQSAGSMG